MKYAERECVRCGTQMCYVYSCDPFYGGCGFIIECEDHHPEMRCPYCKGDLDMKLCCHPEEGGCEYIEEIKRYY